MIRGKKAVITGGSRGIGYAVAKKFLENGANVAVCGSRRETAEKTVAALKAEFPAQIIIPLYPDLTDVASVTSAFVQAENELGGLDILVNNAGLSAMGSIYDCEYSEFKKVIDLNLNAVFVCAQAAAKIMKARGGGVIINTSSMVSKYGQPSGVAYPSSKFAVNGLTLSLARELGKDNIRVNAVAPGVTNTDMMAKVPEKMLAPIVAQIPLGRIGEPEEVANAFLFLASDMASYITGVILSVDGAART